MDLHHGKGGSGGGWGATLGAGSRGVMKAAGGKNIAPLYNDKLGQENSVVSK